MSFKALVTQNERGRSMVEILGVLAVIGVLSFGGIQGYRYAMEKHRANDIVNEVNLRTRDTWNMYQTKDLPDEEEITEWADMTQTGFPIGVYPRSEILFDVEVENVPNGVCKKVLNMDIQGPLFIWVPNGEERLIYNGNNPEICGEDGDEPVNMVFTTSLESFGNEEGLRGNPEDPNGRPFRYCMSDDDCRGCESCDVSEYLCKSNCPDATPICHSTNEVCVACEINEDCSENQVCSEATNACIIVPDKCETGKEYRSANGACIPCTDINVVKISQDAYEYPELNIKDEESGVDQCRSCGNHNVSYDVKTDTTYCSVGCVKGVNYESLNEGCIPCNNPDGTLNTTLHKIPLNNSKAKNLCESCGLIWYENAYMSNACAEFPQCPKGTFLALNFWTNPQIRCISCTVNEGIQMWGWNSWPAYDIATNFKGSSKWSNEKITDICLSCPDYTNGVWSKRQFVPNAGCLPVCEQPTDIQGSIDACKTNPKDTINCKRKFQGSNGVCYACNNSSSIAIGSDENRIQLCKDCGRSVLNGYCLINETCGLGKFKGKDGHCYDCTYVNGNAEVVITDEETSQCIANCRRKDASSHYTSDTSVPSIRWIYTNSSGVQNCHQICPNDKWQNNRGSCMDCSYDGANTWLYSHGLGKEYCDDRCPDGIYARHMENGRCVFKTCPPDSDGMQRFKNTDGKCQRCDAPTENVGQVSKAYCEECPYRFYTYDNVTYYSVCVLVNPGISGVCNSKNVSLSDETLARTDVQAYLNGSYDGQMFRDIRGNCHSCDTTQVPYTTAEQCSMCLGKRTFNNNACSFGGCQSDEFMNNATNCVACSKTSTNYVSSTYQLNDKNTSSCTQCGNRQVMTVGSTGQKYCVPNDCIENADWQSATNGKCQDCSADNNVREIGTESIYQTLCRKCNRLPYLIAKDDKTMWYCSKIYTEGTNFVNSNGEISSCTAGDTQIPDIQDAKNLCRACLSVTRSVETDEDGTVWCVKE